jgi:hypothetical protein
VGANLQVSLWIVQLILFLDIIKKNYSPAKLPVIYFMSALVKA